MTGRRHGALFIECARWIWEQLRDEGTFVDDEPVALVLQIERELGKQSAPHQVIAAAVVAERRRRQGGPPPIDEATVLALLGWTSSSACGPSHVGKVTIR